MADNRYVILGLGRSRSTWFGNISLWTTSGAIPAEFHKCLSAAHVRQRLASMQPYSALIVEEGVIDVDRELIESALRFETPTFVVGHSNGTSQDWLNLGARALFPRELNPADLVQALQTHGRVISSTPVDHAPLSAVTEARPSGRLVTVCGPGGTGSSTVAMAIAQGLADDVTETDHILLADFARNAEQAMLHDCPDVVPGVEEVVELHRHRQPTSGEIRTLTFDVAHRGYRLLLGQRKVGSWTAMNPPTVEATLASLRATFRTVVADITADFECEDDSGSIDVEERNALARISVTASDVVIVVGSTGVKGVHSLVRTMRHVAAAGVDPALILPVVNRAPKRAIAKSELTKAIATLLHASDKHLAWNAPVFLHEYRIDSAIRDNARLDATFTRAISAAVCGLAQTAPQSSATPPQPIPLQPGTLRTAG